MVREIISLHIGGCGGNIGVVCWEQFNLERNFAHSNKLSVKANTKKDIQENTCFYDTTKPGIWNPRCIFIDSDKQSLDQSIHSMEKIEQMNKNNFLEFPSIERDERISYREDFEEVLVDNFRKLTEPIDELEGFWSTLGISGSTSSLIYSIYSGILLDAYTSKYHFETRVIPSTNHKLTTDELLNTMRAWTPDRKSQSCLFTF